MADVNPTRFENIPPYPESKEDRKQNIVLAVIETPKLTRHKFAFNPAFGAFELRATIAEGLTWPYDYGFIPGTLADDGDPLDVLYLNDEPTFTGCLVKARVLGLVRLKKNDVENDRILACAARMSGVSQSTDSYNDVDDLPEAQLSSICRFLVEYSEDQGNAIRFKGTHGVESAFKAIDKAVSAFKKRGKADSGHG